MRKKKVTLVKKKKIQSLSNKNTNVVVIQAPGSSRQRADAPKPKRRGRTKAPKPQVMPVFLPNGVMPGGIPTSLVPSNNTTSGREDTILKGLKTLLDQGINTQNTLLESALRKNVDLLQTDIAKRQFKTPDGQASYTPDPLLTPATRTYMGVESMKDYLKKHLEDIPKAKRYKDKDIDNLQANQLLHLYTETRRIVDRYEGNPDEYGLVPNSAQKLQRILQMAGDEYERLGGSTGQYNFESPDSVLGHSGKLNPDEMG